ncbi:MAG TPA: hypothetical protein VHO48_04775, partial [Anaerolineaceae bacterium]|nr:hypothetical protein [Anaerolineaceae bacterium]
MKARWLLLLFLLGLIVTLGVAQFESTPGYMDAEYYFAGGQRLAQGAGFSEPFLWNYLDSPAGLPHASHLYWMPLASILAAVGMRIAGGVSFFAGRWLFILLTALVAPLTGWTAFRLTGKAGQALLAGILAAFSGFYLPYAATTDTFAVTMLLGTMFLLISGVFWSAQYPRKQLFLAGSLGLIAGFMHLSRADGILWLGLAGLIVITKLVQVSRLQKIDNAHSQQDTSSSRMIARGVALLVVVGVGYLVVISPWYLRNIQMFGSVFSPGSNRTLWLTDYDQMFSLDPANLNVETWLASGIQGILKPRLDALTKNLTTALIVQGGIFLVPLILAGGWAHRKDARVRIAGLAWLMIFLAMTVIFPLAGYRGGFLHSGAAIQPMLWALAPSGLDVFLRWGSRARKWNLRQAWRVFAVGAAGLAILTSGL